MITVKINGRHLRFFLRVLAEPQTLLLIAAEKEKANRSARRVFMRCQAFLLLPSLREWSLSTNPRSWAMETQVFEGRCVPRRIEQKATLPAKGYKPRRSQEL